MSISRINTRLLILQNTTRVAGFRSVNATTRQNATFSPVDSGPRRDVTKEMASVKPYKDIPGPKGIYNLPFIGMLFHMKPFGKFTPETFPSLLTEMTDRYGPVFKIRTTAPMVVVSDPKDIATLVRNEGKYPHRPAISIFEVNSKRSGRPQSVLTLQGEEWLRLRAPMQKTMMKPNLMSRYMPEMNKVADEFVQMLSGDYLKHHDVEETFMAYAAEIAGLFCFNKRLGFLDIDQSSEIKEFKHSLKDILDVLYRTMVGTSISYKYYRSKDYKRFESARNVLFQILAAYIQEAKTQLHTSQNANNSNIDEKDFLNSVLNNSKEEDAIAIMEGTFFAALESSATALQIVLHTLAKNPEKQERLRHEIWNVLGSNELGQNKHVTKADIENMPYLKACVKEVYRCAPINPFGLARILPVGVILGGYHVPAGVHIVTHNIKTSQDETLFENPEMFKPERWLRQNNEDDPDKTFHDKKSRDIDRKWAVIPFGMGVRSCPGRRIFEQELFLVLSKLIHKMHVGLEPESWETEFEYKLFLRPVKPLKFTFTPAK